KADELPKRRLHLAGQLPDLDGGINGELPRLPRKNVIALNMVPAEDNAQLLDLVRSGVVIEGASHTIEVTSEALVKDLRGIIDLASGGVLRSDLLTILLVVDR